uniref:Peptide-methionine (R)-S-oxide reductase n=1 Tax=Phaeomonas parva TaxID=124430 RepID=A0A7S1UG56_9STRA|mmetsp:Transcript_44966/g.140840  ORF Transcript_44966/g.140840 Transcript_44966/m.140840 type:complete len:200 (+) Transcript_44966:192-791(+)|eukprot:CAMPEP_0118880038 /NCGR_PEP_ID=MMETSP1163-20130328/19663_1 /TAXON_ID=124430 /ORGANISM="Phaeomonas parva, Strain CCMP2877" /LENGTH=199 /DNA_ID=CAMNT_0006816317 /DNA_START=139 /DNA_END=738 /DNA_ORIENTATION=-
MRSPTLLLLACAAAGTAALKPVSRVDAVKTGAAAAFGAAWLVGPRASFAKTSRSGVDVTPMSKEEIAAAAKDLPDFSREVLLNARTERSFTGKTVNGYDWSTKSKGVWKSAISDVPLFSSNDKYDSGTGWPSFSRPIDKDHVIERIDPGDKGLPQFLQRVEVLDAKSGGHLGHVFTDGPPPTFKRYCMNAAALKFEPAE